MSRYYLTPEQLRTIPITDLRDEEVPAAIDKGCREILATELLENAAKVLREAGIPVNQESIDRAHDKLKP